jgi:hypothetical protein
MPSENSNRDEKYKDTMAQLEEIIDKFAVDHQIMICGDINAPLPQMILSVSVSSSTHFALYSWFLLIFIKMSFSKEKSQCSCTHKISHRFKVCLRKCVDEETETESIICGRGYGGVATFW